MSDPSAGNAREVPGSKVVDRQEAARYSVAQKQEGKRVVFTNGCFDVLHRGHVDLLRKAAAEGDCLILGANSDESIRRLKGEKRPVVRQEDRGVVLSALEMVDRVVFFGEDTPAEVIRELMPDVLVKGADYPLDEIVGRDTVEGAGGRVVRVPLTSGRSTRGMIETILDRFTHDPNEAPSGKES